jgi:hypothetical protein
MLDSIRLTGTTTAGGAATITAERAVLGLLYAVQWIDGDLANNNTAVLSAVRTDSAVDQALHTQVAGEGDDDGWYYPRVAVHDLSAVGLTYDGTRTVNEMPVINGTLQLVIADGGNAKTGGCIVYFKS